MTDFKNVSILILLQIQMTYIFSYQMAKSQNENFKTPPALDQLSHHVSQLQANFSHFHDSLSFHLDQSRADLKQKLKNLNDSISNSVQELHNLEDDVHDLHVTEMKEGRRVDGLNATLVKGLVTNAREKVSADDKLLKNITTTEDQNIENKLNHLKIGLNHSVNSVSKTLNATINHQQKLLDSISKTLSNQTTNSTRQLAKLKQQLQNITSQLTAYNRSENSLNATLQREEQEFKTKFDGDINANLTSLRDGLGNVTRRVGGLESGLKSTTEKVNELQESVQSVKGQVGELRGEVGKGLVGDSSKMKIP